MRDVTGVGSSLGAAVTGNRPLEDFEMRAGHRRRACSRRGARRVLCAAGRRVARRGHRGLDGADLRRRGMDSSEASPEVNHAIV